MYYVLKISVSLFCRTNFDVKSYTNVANVNHKKCARNQNPHDLSCQVWCVRFLLLLAACYLDCWACMRILSKRNLQTLYCASGAKYIISECLLNAYTPANWILPYAISINALLGHTHTCATASMRCDQQQVDRIWINFNVYRICTCSKQTAWSTAWLFALNNSRRRVPRAAKLCVLMHKS